MGTGKTGRRMSAGTHAAPHTNRDSLNGLPDRMFAALLVDKAVGSLDRDGKLLPWWDDEPAALPYYYFNRYNYEQRFNSYQECLEACEQWLNQEPKVAANET